MSSNCAFDLLQESLRTGAPTGSSTGSASILLSNWRPDSNQAFQSLVDIKSPRGIRV